MKNFLMLTQRVSFLKQKPVALIAFVLGNSLSHKPNNFFPLPFFEMIL